MISRPLTVATAAAFASAPRGRLLLQRCTAIGMTRVGTPAMAAASCLHPVQSRRNYAQRPPMRSPTVRRKANTVKTTRDLFPPNVQNWIRYFEGPMKELGLTISDEQLEMHLLACRQLVNDNLKVSESTLQKDYGMTPYDIHILALLLHASFSQGGVDASSRMTLSIVLLHLACTIPERPGGYLPSTLTLIYLFGDNPAVRRASGGRSVAPSYQQGQFYKNAERRFVEYLGRFKTPLAASAPEENRVQQANAYTLAGLLAEGSGDATRAMRWYAAASIVGKTLQTTDEDLDALEEGEDIVSRIDEPDTIEEMLKEQEAKVFGNAENEAGEEKPASSREVDKARDEKPRKPRWDWERQCLESWGLLRLKASRDQAPAIAKAIMEAEAKLTKNARARREKRRANLQATYAAHGRVFVWPLPKVDLTLLRRAALALGSFDASLIVAKELIQQQEQTLRPDEQTEQLIEQLLQYTASAGKPEALRLLADREEAQSLQIGSGSEAKWHRLVAEQWRMEADAVEAAAAAAARS